MNWYLKVLKQYVGFSGRAQRMEFWMYNLINFLILIGIAIIEAIIGTGGIIYFIYALGVFLPGLAVAVRRLHDTNHSGWWLLISLVPVIGIIILIVFWVQDSHPGANDFGPNPKGATA